MILGLDISTSITGWTVADFTGNVIEYGAWDTRKYKDFFDKAEAVSKGVTEIHIQYGGKIKHVYIEQSLQTFRSGFSSAKTLSSLSHGLFTIYFRFSQNTSRRQVLESSVASKFPEEKKQSLLS